MTEANANQQLSRLEAQLNQYNADPRRQTAQDHGQAVQLTQELNDAKQQLESLRLAEGPDWQTHKLQYEQSEQRLQRSYEQATRQ